MYGDRAHILSFWLCSSKHGGRRGSPGSAAPSAYQVDGSPFEFKILPGPPRTLVLPGDFPADREVAPNWRPLPLGFKGRPIKGRPTLRSSKSADVRDPFLHLRLGWGSGLRRQLEHCCVLTFRQVRQKHNLPVRKFQGVMMGARLIFLICRKMAVVCSDFCHFAAKRPISELRTSLSEGEFSARKNTNRRPRIFRLQQTFACLY